MPKTLTFYIGPNGVGKTTVQKQRAKFGEVVVDFEVLRFEVLAGHPELAQDEEWVKYNLPTYVKMSAVLALQEAIVVAYHTPQPRISVELIGLSKQAQTCMLMLGEMVAKLGWKWQVVLVSPTSESAYLEHVKDVPEAVEMWASIKQRSYLYRPPQQFGPFKDRIERVTVTYA